MKIPKGQPRYFPGGKNECHRRADQTMPGEKVLVFPCGQMANKFEATVVSIDQTPQKNNLRVIVMVKPYGFLVSLGGGTSVRCHED